MKTSLIFLSLYLPCVAARSSAPSSFRIRPWGVVETPRGSPSGESRLRVHAVETPRGGARQEGFELDFSIDSFQSLLNAGATVFAKEVAPVLKRESKNAIKYGKEFLEQQKKNAEKRRQQYREQAGDFKATASTLADPVRALKLTFSAFFIAEALNYVDGQDVYLDDLSDLAVVAADNALFSAQNFWKVGRQPGGLLRGGTWTNRKKFLAAVDKQILPKYQWAIGAALGFVISPALWSVGWAAFGWSAVVYAVAESHNFLKRTYFDSYFLFLKKTKNPLIYLIDDLLEDVREFVEALMLNPKATLFAARENLDVRVNLDFDFPPELQRGLLFGAFAGVLGGA